MNGYLLPEYWDGKVLGGPTVDPLILGPCDRTSQQVAFTSLEHFLERQPAKPPFMIGQPCPKGEEFDASQHPPGSIFWINHEILAAERSHIPPPPAEADVPLPKDPADHELTIMWNGVLRYTRRNYWGVTSLTRNEQGVLFLAAANFQILSPKGRVLPKQTFRVPSPLVVGQARHTRIGKYEFLQRANRIYQCLPGQARRRPVRGWRAALGSLANPGIANLSGS